MAWDNTQPTNTTKIRNLGVVIRPNWVAIETADTTFRPQALNFKDRTVAGLPVNPTALADAFINFCKESATGNSEFFGIDENSNVIQFSEVGRIGGPNQNFHLNTYRFNSRGQDYSINNIIHAYGRFASNGATVVSNNCSIVRNSTGRYTVTLNVAATNALYVPIATCLDEGNARIAKVAVTNSSVFTIHVVNESGDNRDCGVFFHVCGGF